MLLVTVVNVSVLHIHPLSRSGLGSSKMLALAGMSLDLATRLDICFGHEGKGSTNLCIFVYKAHHKYGFDCISIQQSMQCSL